tara:strand:+ start:101 stop:430 length:330 start_codon:yes stop_codon:yes gene_type:complete
MSDGYTVWLIVVMENIKLFKVWIFLVCMKLECVDWPVSREDYDRLGTSSDVFAFKGEKLGEAIEAFAEKEKPMGATSYAVFPVNTMSKKEVRVHILYLRRYVEVDDINS